MWIRVLFILMTLAMGVAHAQSGDYRVGPGDVLDVRIFEEDQLSRQVRVSADGMISYPLVGKVAVNNLSALEIADRLTALLARDYLVNPQVSVSVAEFVSKQVKVLGAVKAPGQYSLHGSATITTMLARAGGLGEHGGKTLLLLRPSTREGEIQAPQRIDLYALLTEGKAKDLDVSGGDVVFIPRADEVYVMGEVTQPGAVVFQDGMTLLQAISKVGAFKLTAAPNRVQVIRRQDGKELVLRVDAKRIQEGKESDLPLQPEDLITVPKSIF